MLSAKTVHHSFPKSVKDMHTYTEIFPVSLQCTCGVVTGNKHQPTAIENSVGTVQQRKNGRRENVRGWEKMGGDNAELVN